MFEEAQDSVAKFHQCLGHSTPNQPTPIDKDRLSEVIVWMKEELDELSNASNMADQLDAIADLLYFVFGIFVEMGVDGGEIFRIVHEANMRKLGKEIQYHPDGKIKRPENWLPPETEIQRYLDVAKSVETWLKGVD